MARPPNRAERRREILTAFRDVLADEGYAGTTIARVAERAGLTPGLLHYHFESKASMLVALVEDLAAGLEARAEARGARAGRGGARAPLVELDAWIDAFLAPGEDADPRSLAAYVGLASDALREPEPRALWTQALQHMQARLAASFARELTARGRSTEGAGALAGSVLAALHGSAYLGVAVPGSMVPGEPARLLKLWVRAALDA